MDLAILSKQVNYTRNLYIIQYTRKCVSRTCTLNIRLLKVKLMVEGTFYVLHLWTQKKIYLFIWGFTSAALCNAHGQCDQIFAKVGDGRLRQ